MEVKNGLLRCSWTWYPEASAAPPGGTRPEDVSGHWGCPSVVQNDFKLGGLGGLTIPGHVLCTKDMNPRPSGDKQTVCASFHPGSAYSPLALDPQDLVTYSLLQNPLVTTAHLCLSYQAFMPPNWSHLREQSCFFCHDSGQWI